MSIIFTFGGAILDTGTRLNFSIFASLNAYSKLNSGSSAIPIPEVKKTFFGTRLRGS